MYLPIADYILFTILKLDGSTVLQFFFFLLQNVFDALLLDVVELLINPTMIPCQALLVGRIVRLVHLLLRGSHYEQPEMARDEAGFLECIRR